MTNKDKQDVIAVCNILADKMSDGGKVAVQQIIGAVEDMVENEPCEDCISRKDVIILIDEATELHPYKVIGDSETYSNYNQGWEDACNWLYANVEGDNLKTVTPQQKWIPVSERLPEDGTWNIWQSKNGALSIERYKEDAYNHFYPSGRFFSLEDAVAWMPLPQPYKESEDSK